MKGLGRILGRYVGAAIGVGVLLLVLNAAAFIAFVLHCSQDMPEIEDRVSVIAEGIRQQADGGFSVSEEARTALDERYVWAMQLDDDGNIIWGDRMPEDLPRHFTAKMCIRDRYAGGVKKNEVWKKNHCLGHDGGGSSGH